MKYLFHHKFHHKHHLHAKSKPANWQPANRQRLLVFDLDGTLSPIVKDPTKAIIPKSTMRLLNILSKQDDTDLVILTGRSTSSAKGVVGDLLCKIIGNHGLEANFISATLKSKWRKRCAQVVEILKSKLSSEHYCIEDKKYSLSIHARAINKKLLSIVCPLLTSAERIIHGKNVINIMPTKKIHKGTTLLKLKRLYKSDYVLFVGDDCTDEDVFEINDASVGVGVSIGIVTIKIGYKRKSKAQFYLKEQREINQLLRALIIRD